MKKFEITEDHIKLLQKAYFGWENCEFGAPAIDCKRPYGNSDVLGDIAEILGWKLEEDDYGYKELSEDQRDKAEQLHYGLENVLQIGVQLLKFEVGTYIYNKEWEKIGG